MMSTSGYKISDAADFLQVSQKLVRKYIQQGLIKAVKKGGAYQLNKEDLRSLKNKIDQEEKEAYHTKEKSRKSTRTDVINWAKIEAIWDKKLAFNFTSADLFCGAGGMTKGFEMAGFKPIAALDWFKEAVATYQKNFEHPAILGDITQKTTKQEFIDTVQNQLEGKPLTVLSGGFPCQGFSMAGNRIVEDQRNSLYKDMLEIIDVLQPQYIVAENVKGLRSMLNGKVEDKIIADMKALGYHINVTVLNAADYGVPQKRERVIFIGNRLGAKNFHPEPILKPENYISTQQAIEDLVNVADNKSFNHVRTKHSEQMKKRLAAVPEGKSLYKNYSDAWKKCPWNEASCTIKENHGGVNIHPKEARVITVREMARLQSFPDDFIFEGAKGKQMVQIGNAVPPLLAKAIGLSIYKSILNQTEK